MFAFSSLQRYRTIVAVTKIECIVRLRVVVRNPPKGVRWCLQRGASELAAHAVSKDGEDLSFDLEVRAQPLDGGVRFLGPFTQGPPKARFLYLCSGTSAGQRDSCWTRRAKIPLPGIDWPMALAGRTLLAGFEGTAKDGGPACAGPVLGKASF